MRVGIAFIASLASLACGGGPPPSPRPAPAAVTRGHALRSPGRPTVVSLERDGDPRSGMSVVLATDGADAPGAVAIGLAAVLSTKLDAKLGARVTPLPSGVRVDALFDSPEGMVALADAVRSALVVPIDAAAWTAASQALASAPHLESGPEARVAACEGRGIKERDLTKAELDLALPKIVGAIGVVGTTARIGGGPQTIASGAIWPKGARACKSSDDPHVAYELHGVAVARGDVLAWRRPEESLDAARDIGPLLAKLRAADPAARLTDASAVAGPSGACVDVRIEMPSADPATIARLGAIALDEMDRHRQGARGGLPSDPRDAAEVLASEELSGACATGKSSMVVAFPTGDSPKAEANELSRTPDRREGSVMHVEKLDSQLRSELGTATAAWGAPGAAVTRLLESGQPEALVFVGSPCGARSESRPGATLLVLSTLARQASGDGVDADPVVSFDAAGILARSHALPGESPLAFGKRLGEAAGRAFATDPLGEPPPALSRAPDDAFSVLASSLVVDHPSWVDPRFVDRASQSLLEARRDAIRRGPVRVVVLSNDGTEQADAIAAGVDRFLLRQENPSCSPDPHVDPPRPGTYAVQKHGASEAYLALPVPTDPSCASAPFLVSSLPELLSKALAGVARSSDARMIVTPVGRFLAVHVDAPGGSLDAAVSQTRALFDRLRQGALSEADLSRAVAKEDLGQKAAALDPRVRVIRAWRGEQPPPPPSLEALRACARVTFRDEALVIAAARFYDVPVTDVLDTRWFPVGTDEVALFRDGKAAFPAMLRAIDEARSEVLLEMYWVSPDTCGLRFLDALVAAARRGVAVRVVYDAIGSLGLTPAFWEPLRRAGGETHEFHALFPIRNAVTTGALERRDHRKLLVVDSFIGFTGGINLSRQWMPVEEGGEGWRDDMVGVRGNATQELRTLFYDTWRRVDGASVPDDVRQLPRKRRGPVWTLTNLPPRLFGPVRATMKSRRRSIRREYLWRVEQAKTSIEIANSYFVPNRSVRGGLFRAAARGVRVRVLVPERGDVPIVQFAVESLFDTLVKNGVEVYTLPGRVMHAKTAIIDDSFATIGSYNLDERSWAKNVELNLAVEDNAFASHVRSWFDQDCAEANRIGLDSWRDRSYTRRAAEWVAYGLRRLW